MTKGERKVELARRRRLSDGRRSSAWACSRGEVEMS